VLRADTIKLAAWAQSVLAEEEPGLHLARR
jgi:hypothetical protein